MEHNMGMVITHTELLQRNAPVRDGTNVPFEHRDLDITLT